MGRVSLYSVLLLLVILDFSRAFAAGPHLDICPGLLANLADKHLQSEFTNQSRYPSVYDQVLELFAPHRELRKMHSAAMPRGNVRIIDAGGGTGLLTRHLLQDDPQRHIEIFDLSNEMTTVARDKGVNSQNIHVSSITNLVRSDGSPVLNGSIDGVMTNNVIYILSRQQIGEFFAEARRVLRLGGRLSVSSMRTVPRPTMDSFLHSLKSDVAKMEAEGLVPAGSSNIFFNTNVNLTRNSPTTFTNEEIVAIARSYGFRPILENGLAYQGTAFFVSFEKEN